MPILYLIARVLMGAAFLFAGLRNAAQIPALTEAMVKRGIPQPRNAMLIGVALQIVSGALLMIGLWPALGAAGLIVFVVLATVLFHNFWDYSGAERGPHLGAATVNTSLVGAFLMVIATSI